MRADRRGTGIGRAIVNVLIDKAMDDGEGLLLVECAPRSSAAFWENMGFGIETGRNHVYAKRILLIPRAIPPNATPVEAIVRFFPEDRGPVPVVDMIEHRPVAVRDAEGTVWFNQKMANFSGEYANAGDLEVELIVDGIRAYFGKANCERAAACGFFACRNGYAIEKVILCR